MPVTPQILLPLEGRRRDSFDNFVPGPNAAIVAALQELIDSGGQCLFLNGPAGSGKTHLLNAACNLARSRGLQAFYIAPGRLPLQAAAGLADLDHMDLVCVDDIDQCLGIPAWEEALFHCFNRLRAEGGSLVASSSQNLSALPFELPDLASRLAWGLRLQLYGLDDKAKAEVMQNWAGAHDIQLPLDVQNYLLNRDSRSLATLLERLESVLQAALASKRKMTVPLAREVIRTEKQRDEEKDR
jgi:DnaA family protein